MKLSLSLLLSTICFLFVSCQTTLAPKATPTPTAILVPKVSAEQLFRKDYVSTVDNEAHQYFVYLPRGYGDQPNKKWPVMLLLHCNGERGNGRDDLDYVIAHCPVSASRAGICGWPRYGSRQEVFLSRLGEVGRVGR